MRWIVVALMAGAGGYLVSGGGLWTPSDWPKFIGAFLIGWSATLWERRK